MACQSSREKPDSELPKIEPTPMTRSAVSGTGACRHLESGLCFEALSYKHSDEGCTDKKIEEYLPGGCPVAGRLARCELFNGSARFWAYSDESAQVTRQICTKHKGVWKKY